VGEGCYLVTILQVRFYVIAELLMCEKCSDNIYLHVLLYLNSNFSEAT
jgi:hypothetical protein